MKVIKIIKMFLILSVILYSGIVIAWYSTCPNNGQLNVIEPAPGKTATTINEDNSSTTVISDTDDDDSTTTVQTVPNRRGGTTTTIETDHFGSDYIGY